MDMTNLTGSIVALVTPFAEDGSVDYPALERLVDFHLANGTDGILVLGTTGESSTMTDEEDLEVARCVVERVGGRIPGDRRRGLQRDLRVRAQGRRPRQRIGVDGLLLITPYYNKSNEEGIYRHFTAVLDKVDVPCILYNIPGRTGCSISEKNLARLARHPNAWGIKEASGSIGYATMAAQYLSDDFRMFSGNDDIVVPLMSLGAKGVISVWADVAPATVHQMCADFLAGDVEAARRTQLENLELIHALFCEVNPIPVKCALAEMGMIGEHYRQPLWTISDAGRERLRRRDEGGSVCLASAIVIGGAGRMGRLVREELLARGFEASRLL